MGSVVVEVELPEEALEFYGSREAVQQTLTQSAVLELVRRDEIDPSLAASWLGMHLLDFVQLMADHGIDYYRFTKEEWAAEVATVKEMVGELHGKQP